MMCTAKSAWVGFVAVALSFTMAAGLSAASVPFSDGFETNSAGQDLDAVEGASGWETTDGVGGAGVVGRAIVQTAVKSAGANGVILTNGTLVNNFTTAGLSNVWTSFEIQPVFHEGTPTPPDDATVAFYFFSNGNVRAYNGQSTVSNLGNTTISTTAFNSVTIHSDYGNQNYDLYVGGVLVANDFGFYSNTVTTYDQLIVDQDDITQSAYLDEFSISTLSPLQPTISWSGDTVVTNDENTVRVLTAVINFASQITVTGNVAETQITTESGDITFASSQVVIAPGLTSASFNVTITDDVEHETPYESSTICLSSPNALLGSFACAVVVISDDADLPPNLYFTASSGTGSENPGGAVTVNARLDGSAQEDVATTVSTGGTATQGAGDDYTMNNLSLNFTAGNMAPDSETQIVVVDNSADEPSETVVLTLASGTGALNAYPAVGASNTFTYTITDDDISTLPFVETFDTALTPLGDLDGARGWSSSNTTVTAASGQSMFSSQSAYSSNNGALAHGFTDSSATNVFTSFYIQPTFGEAGESAIPTNASVALYVNATGSVVAYNAGVATVLANTLIPTNSSPKFTIHSDYSAQTYSLYLDDVIIATDFDFYTNIAPSSFTEFAVGGDGNASSIVDNVNIALDNPFYAITSVIEQVGNAARIFIDQAANGASYRLLKKGPSEGSFSLLSSKTMGAPPHYFDDTTIDADGTRQYRVTNFNPEGEDTNDATWIAQHQARTSNGWHMVSLPGQFGDTNLNTLNNRLGQELAKGLDGDNTEALAPQVWIYEGGWNSYWMDAANVFHPAGAPAVTSSNRVEAGEGVWIKTSQDPDTAGILAGQVHASSVPINMPASTWVLFAWPFADAEANSVAGWGFSNTFTSGTSWDNSSRIFMRDGSQYYNLYLSAADGLWKIQNTSTTAPVSMRPGQAYYFYNAGGAATYLASPAN